MTSSRITVAFAQALEEWCEMMVSGATAHAGTQQLLLERYEAICDEEIHILEIRLQSSSSITLAKSLCSHISLLRGERSSWRLLRHYYHDFDARQQTSPQLPALPESWCADLRGIGFVPPPPTDEVR